jgi:hypothetical protein
MADETTEPAVTPTAGPVRDAESELARKNMLWGWALFGLFLLLFGGTAGVAFVYLWLS